VTGSVGIGPKFGDPLTIHVMKASAEAALQAVDQVVKAFNVPDVHNIDPGVHIIERAFGTAINDYARSTAESGKTPRPKPARP
jgi:hypothetical protein